MAYGLRSLSNGSYMPYGSGRDWFFIGDFEYRNGRRTPGPNDRNSAQKTKPVARDKKPPFEVSVGRSFGAPRRHDQVSPGTVERWRQHHAASTCNDVVHEMRENNNDVPRWRAQEASARQPSGKYSKLRRVPSAPELSACNDTTPGARTYLAGGNFTATSMDLGKLPGWREDSFGQCDKHHHHSISCFPTNRFTP
eukprot:TRINITY_DN70914_c0_g1_i1.p1 TRINITY_DN70914_c0_g1~~TRINITY_DN70914_c0_g1_i1.p1  ORF type:complete len:218 (+),score=18.24 TRINITY_DN70914_c0_g1_i1:70-654(+)